jgi:integrase
LSGGFRHPNGSNENLLQRRIEVVEALEERNGQISIGPTKTGRPRTLNIPSLLADMIGWQIKRYPPKVGTVCTSNDRKYLRHSNFYDRYYQAAVRKAGLEPLRFHDLRHTYAAFLIHQGANAKQVMALMGHSTIRVTFDRYGHLFEGHDETLIEGLDGALRAAHFSRTSRKEEREEEETTTVLTRDFSERTTVREFMR